MQITLTRKVLTSAFPWVYKGLPKYPVVPVLAGMLLSVSEQRLTLAVFDYQQSRRVTVPGVEGAAKSGEILVDGRVLKKLLGTLPAADVELVADDAALTVTAGRQPGASRHYPGPSTRLSRTCRRRPARSAARPSPARSHGSPQPRAKTAPCRP